MPKFKVGDVVEYTHPKGQSVYWGARKIAKESYDLYIYENDNRVSIKEADQIGGEFELRLVTKAGKIKGEDMKKECKSWTFNTIAPAIDIDFYIIAADLSKAHPIATVAVDGEEGPQDYVVILKSLLAKADTCDMPIELYTGLIEEDVALNAETFVVYWTERSEYRRIINFAKIVKEARYPDEYKNKGKVTVSVVKV